MADKKVTTQTNLKGDNNGKNGNKSNDFTSYAYFLGGVDARAKALQQYDMLRKGYGRIFILRMPAFIKEALPDATAMFKHLLEYGNTGIDGINGYTADFSSITGGYVGDSIELPTNSKDDTSSITIKLYETASSLVRSYLDFWITGAAADPISGLVHYHGAAYSDDTLVPVCQANQIMEALYVNTDQTGKECTYACLLTNMFPKSSDHSHANYDPGTHDMVDMSIEFTAKKYMSASINALGQHLVDQYAIMRNYLNYQHGYYGDEVTGGTVSDNKLADMFIADYAGSPSRIADWENVKNSNKIVNTF